jgi:hypothetical protein
MWIVLVCCLGFLVSCGGGGKTAPATPTLQSVSVTPQSASVVAGRTQQYSATGSYSDGSTGVVSTVAWTTSDSTVATINSSGLLTAIKHGSVTVSAMSGATTGSTSVTITPPDLVSIAVSPQNPAVRIANTRQFVATGTFTDGGTQLLSTVTWNSSSTAFATIDATGLALGISPGVSTIQAASGKISGSTTLNVFSPSQPSFNYVMGATFSSGDTKTEGVVLADYNGDGKIDIAVSNFNTNTIAVFLNDGTGNFGAPVITSVTTPANLGAMVGGDFNEDGKPDLVVSTIDGGSQVNLVLLGNGDGTFAVQPAIKNSFGFVSAAVADINGDGHQDLVIGQNGGVVISLGRGDGTFVDTTPLQSSGVGTGLYLGISGADFNGDGKIDIVASDYDGFVIFYAGNGDGTFAAPTSMSNNNINIASLANGDFDGDGKQDILLGFVNSAVINIGKGDGTFDLNNYEFVYSSAPTNLNDGIEVIASDLTNTGKIDAVTTDFTNGILQITLNGSLGLIPPSNGILSFQLGAGLSSVAAADLNGDGIKDVVAINNQTGQVTTILSQK